jgi:hypothetical protein
LSSWKDKNPEWDFRCLDAWTAIRYAPFLANIDLCSRTVTAASLSDILRISLLHEFGGVWVDATVFCNRPIDEWLPQAFGEGFFAFNRPGPDRLLSSWFLAADPGHPIVTEWARTVQDYWSTHKEADHYFWFHRLFESVCDTNPRIARMWDRVPKISADGPHRIQQLGLLSDASKTAAAVDWSTPCFKLTHRYDESAAGPDCLLRYLIGFDRTAPRDEDQLAKEAPLARDPSAFVSLSVSTENLGDHIQIQSGLELLGRFGLSPRIHLDRDFGLRSAPGLEAGRSYPILLNGWFKRDSPEWPPHPRLEPIFLGFHIRLFQSPSLLSDESLAYYRAHQPIGCRDWHTAQLLTANGVEAYESHCPTMTFPRRLPAPSQREVFVVSRDARLSQAVPTSLRPFTSILHYSGDTDFERNLAHARKLLEVYRDRARLIVTSLLHCAMPALALGIPVVVFYPLNTPEGHASDQERFSSLKRLLRIWRFDEMDEVDWSPIPPDMGAIKLALIDDLSARLETMGFGTARKLGPIAQASALPPP